ASFFGSNTLNVFIRYAISRSETKVSALEISPVEDISIVLQMLEKLLSKEIKLYKDGQQIESGMNKELVSMNDVLDLTCHTPKITPENSPSPHENPLGASFAIAIELPTAGGISKLIDQNIMFKELIGSLKSRLAEEVNMDPEDFILVHKGQTLEPHMTAQEAGIRTYARLILLPKLKQTVAETSSSKTATIQAVEDPTDVNMEDLITTIPIECDGVTHEISISREHNVDQLAIRYATKAQDSKYENYIICNKSGKIFGLHSIEYEIAQGTIKYGQKLHLAPRPEILQPPQI